MSIRIEIAAETVDELVILLTDLRQLGLTVAPGATVLVREDEAEAAVTADFTVEEPITKEAPKKKRGRPAKVKPLPDDVDDDPLAAATPEAEEPEEEFEAPPAIEPDKLSPEALIGAATDKLRDLFKINAAGVAGVRKLRDKYQVKFFHEVPPGKAKALWADTLKLEGELSA